MNKPNYNRKYKTKFYILLVLGICSILSLLSIPYTEKMSDDYESKMVEGKDYFQETIVIDKKDVKKEVNIIIYDFLPIYTNGTINEHYYIYSNGIEVLTNRDTYNALNIGDNVNVYRSMSNEYFTSPIALKRHNYDPILEILILSNIMLPGLGLLLIIYLFGARKYFKNPYYAK